MSLPSHTNIEPALTDLDPWKAAEEALQRERTFSDAVLDSVPGLLYLYDENGFLVRWNKKHEELTGYTAEELSRQHISDWFRGKDVEYLAARIKQAFLEGYADGEGTLVAKDGTKTPFYFTGVRVILDGKKYMAGIGIDISQRKAAEEALQKSETFYRMLFQSATDAIFLMKNAVFIECNPAASRIFGHTRAELIGQFPYQFSPARQPDGQDSRELALEKIQATLEGKPQSFAWTHRHASGSLIPTEVSLNRMDVGGETIILAIVRDVTERKKAEDLLRKLSQAVEQSPVNVAITDLNGNIEYVNPMFCERTGYALEEAIGKNPRVLKSGHTTDEEYRDLWRTIRSGGIWSGDFLNKAKDGTLFWERARITSIKDAAGQITHYLAVKEDISDRIKAEEKMQQMRQQLAHVARLSTLGEMAAELAHELNHPLYAILNYAKASRNLLSEEGPTDLNSLRDWNEEIASIASSAGEVVKRLRSFAKRADSSRSTCRIEEIVEQALGLFAVELRIARTMVETAFDPASPPIQVDRVQIQQILVNLLSNAVEAMEAVPADMRRIAIQSFAGDAEIEVVVSDCGVGLPAESETRIFEPYVTTKPEGLGMGLSIARTIIEAHGGRLWATSNPEGGAAFHFTLPLEHGGRSRGV